MPNRFSLNDLLLSARRRETLHLFLDKAVLASSVGLIGAVVLLLAGTQILNWYWVLLLTATSFAVGFFQLRKSIPALYEVAQTIDRRLGFRDALSTAFYFSENPDALRRPVAELQRKDAEQIAGTVDLQAAMPLRPPRRFALVLALAAVAVGLFGVRYFVAGSMDLDRSLLRIAYDSFFGEPNQQAKSRAPDAKGLFRTPEGDNPAGLPESSELQPESQLDRGDAVESGADPDSDAKVDGKEKGSKDGAAQDAKDKDDDRVNDPKQSFGKDSKDQAKGGDKSGSKDGKQESASSSLLDKMKEALSNMMNKLKPQSENQQSVQNQQGQQKGSAEQQQSKDAQDQQSQEGSDQDQQSSSSSKQTSADAKGKGNPSDQKSKDGQSGAGSGEGDKATRLAEQIQAMGKISEILGKRSATLTGQVMVEVGDSKQQLKTPWASSDAAHAEAGSEIHRDEIPLLYQQFVRQYFEEVHKPAPPARRPDSKDLRPAEGK